MPILYQTNRMKLKISILFICFIFSTAFTFEAYQIEDHKIDAEKLYKSNCRICHGSKGKLGINGATNLQKSTLSNQDIIEVITNGRGVMTSFKGILDEKEIKAVAKYVNKLKND